MMHVIRVGMLFALLSAAAPERAAAQERPPLQVDAQVRAKGTTTIGATFQRQLQPGIATLSGRVHNLAGGETVRVHLHFDYKTDADIALDEIIDRIVISIEDASGKEFSRATINPNDINLNPNRVPLDYAATLYKPESANEPAGYLVHVRVFGNYE